jgi:hypothetical protein
MNKSKRMNDSGLTSKTTAAQPGYFVVSPSPDGSVDFKSRDPVIAWEHYGASRASVWPVTLTNKHDSADAVAVLLPDGRVWVIEEDIYATEAEWLDSWRDCPSPPDRRDRFPDGVRRNSLGDC